MIWWGYAGFSGAIVISLALLAFIVGVSVEGILALTANTASALLAFGILVHACALGLRRRRRTHH